MCLRSTNKITIINTINMSNSQMQPRSFMLQTLSQPHGRTECTPEAIAGYESLADREAVFTFGRTMNLVYREGITIPRPYYCDGPEKLKMETELVKRLRKEPKFTGDVPAQLVVADKGKQMLVESKRTAPAMRLVAAVANLIPRVSTTVNYEQVDASAGELTHASGRVEMTFGRVTQYLKKNGSKAPKWCINPLETARAIYNCGFRPPRVLPVPEGDKDTSQPLRYPERHAVMINYNSNSGFPVKGKLREYAKVLRIPEGQTVPQWVNVKPLQMITRLDKLAMIVSIQEAITEEIMDGYPHGGTLRDQLTHVIDFWKEVEVKRPVLMLFEWKCKEDYYSLEKIGARKMRMYVGPPRHVALMISQAAAGVARDRFHLSESSTDEEMLRAHSSQGLSLAGSGADVQIKALNKQMKTTGMGYLHCSDDTIAAIREGIATIMLSLDCSAYDMTQHNKLGAEVHLGLASLYHNYDPVGAGTFLKVMQGRNCVIAGGFVAQVEHGMPSGVPEGSSVNDCVMDVLMQRLQGQLMLETTCPWNARTRTPEELEADIRRLVASTADDMGLSVRVEDLHVHLGETEGPEVYECLRRRPFKYLGAYLHNIRDVVSRDLVVAMFDPERMWARICHKSQKWETDTDRFALSEVMRLASLVLNMGVPTVDYSRLHYKTEEHVLGLIDQAYFDYPDLIDTEMTEVTSILFNNPMFVTMENAQERMSQGVAADDVTYRPTLRGLRKAMVGRLKIFLPRGDTAIADEAAVQASIRLHAADLVAATEARAAAAAAVMAANKVEDEDEAKPDGKFSAVFKQVRESQRQRARGFRGKGYPRTEEEAPDIRAIARVKTLQRVAAAVEKAVPRMPVADRKRVGMMPRRNTLSEKQAYREKGLEHKQDARERQLAQEGEGSTKNAKAAQKTTMERGESQLNREDEELLKMGRGGSAKNKMKSKNRRARN